MSRLKKFFAKNDVMNVIVNFIAIEVINSDSTKFVTINLKHGNTEINSIGPIICNENVSNNSK